MKAAVCHEFGRPLVIEDVEIAPPQSGEVKIKMTACAICHSDISYAEGAWGGTLPAVYGHEGAGVVEEVGPSVATVKPGDHVVVTLIRSCGHCHYCVQGHLVACETRFHLDEETPLRRPDGTPITQGLRTAAFAEYAVVDSSQLVAIPHDVPFDSASLLGCGVITGLGAVVNSARVRPGANVVIIGTGGVGLNSVQGAASCGANSVVAVDLSDSKLEAAKRFGATHTINPSKASLSEQVRTLTNGRGADFVFVTVGVKAAFDESYALLSRTGTAVLVGIPADGVMSEIDPGAIAEGSQRIIGSKMGSSRIRVDVPYLIGQYKQGRLKLDELISGRYPLEEINEAISSVNRGEALRNVVVF